MVVDRKLSEAELFQVVGAGWKQQESEKRKKTFQEKLKRKPVFSMFLLFLIVLGCVFANVVANHDPSGFYLQNLNTPPGKEFIFGTDSLGSMDPDEIRHCSTDPDRLCITGEIKCYCLFCEQQEVWKNNF